MRRRANFQHSPDSGDSTGAPMANTQVLQPIPSDQQGQLTPDDGKPLCDPHASTRSNERSSQGKYGCPYCHTNFPHPCLCRSHCGKVHPELPVPNQVDMVRARYDDFRPPLPVKAFSCPICSCSRKSYNGLLEHLRSAHQMRREDYPTRQACMLLSQKRNAEREVYVQYHRQMQQIRNQTKCTVCGKKLIESRLEPTMGCAPAAKNCVCGSSVCSNCVAYDSGFCLSRGYINGSSCGAHTGQIFGEKSHSIAWTVLNQMTCDSTYSQSARVMAVADGMENIAPGKVLFYGALNALIGARSHLSELGSRQYVQALFLPQLGGTKTMLLPVTSQRDGPVDALDQRFFADTLQDRAFSQYAAGQIGAGGQMEIALVSAFDSSFLPAMKHSNNPNTEIQLVCVRTPRAALINNQILPELLHAEVVFAVVARDYINVGDVLTAQIRSEDPTPGIRHTINTLYDHAEREQTVLSNVIRQRDMQNSQTRPPLPMQMLH